MIQILKFYCIFYYFRFLVLFFVFIDLMRSSHPSKCAAGSHVLLLLAQRTLYTTPSRGKRQHSSTFFIPLGIPPTLRKVAASRQTVDFCGQKENTHTDTQGLLLVLLL